MRFLIILLLCYTLKQSGSSNLCDLQEAKFGFVCKCTADRCDYLKEPKLKNEDSWFAVTSSKGGLRFSLFKGNFTESKSVVINDYNVNKDSFVVSVKGVKKTLSLTPKWERSSLTIDRCKTFQKIVGFGGALTGSVAYLLDKLQKPLQDHLYKSYFHKDGIAYNILRYPIGGCDFDLEPWAYNEMPENDRDLTNFTKLDQRDLLKIDKIKKIKLISELDNLKILAATWSPPPWMKSNHKWTGASNLKKEYYQTWANYHLKYLELMFNKNITIWAISTGNEPFDGTRLGALFIKFMSLGWTPSNQAIYLEDNLGPALKKSQFKNVLIFGNDDQRFSYPEWFLRMNSSRPRSLAYLDGLAVHWYWDDFMSPTIIDDTIKLMPDKLLLNTEACVGSFPGETHGPELGSWERGEKYARSLLQDLQHNFNGWVDWNLLLNEKGGPNYVNNTVDSPIIVNTTNYAEFYKQPMFYVMGHFSKFVSENSERIAVKISSILNTIDAVGFKRPDNQIVLIIFNSGPYAQFINLNDSIRGIFNINAPARSLLTVVYK